MIIIDLLFTFSSCWATNSACDYRYFDST